ncbi:MAG: hypothetical protein GC192_22610 [Bacteroidetes bacterium]|nr:hypothetical protein [Bacteroidota bacterium]
MQRLLFALLFLYLQMGVSNCQEYIANLRQIGLRDGLSHQEIHSFLQDKRGLVWVGTKYGLNRFDGKSFTNWTPIENGMPNSPINFLMEDQAGWIWAISTKNPYLERDVMDISLVHEVSGEVQDFEQKFGEEAPFKPADIMFFFTSPSRILYFLTNNGFWEYLPDQGFVKLNLPTGVSPLRTLDDQLFFGTNANGLVRFDSDGRLIGVKPFEQRPYQKWVQGSANGLWLRQLGGPMLYFPEDSQTPVICKMDFGNGERKPFCFDAKRNWAWVADFENLKAFDAAGNKVFDLQIDYGEKLPYYILALFVDRNGLVWMGTRYGFHLLELKKNRFKRYLYADPTNEKVDNLYRCRGLLEKNGILFVNSYLGCRWIDLQNGKVSVVDRPQVFPNSNIYYSFFEGKNGDVWTACNHLSQMDAISGKLLQNFEIPGDGYKLWAIYEDREGKVWLNKGNGIFILKDGQLSKFQAYNGFDELQKSQVYSYLEDKKGELWLGTDNGLYQVSQQRGVIDHFWMGGKNAKYLPGTQIQHIHEDADGYFWMATENEGLIKWHPESHQLRHITRADGLPATYQYALLCVRGRAWVPLDEQ